MISGRAIIVLLGTLQLGAPGSAAGQTPTPTPPAVPDANPGRPTVSTPATLTPVGFLQIEAGVLGARAFADFSSRTGVNDVIKVTVHPRLQLLAQMEPVVWTRAGGSTEVQAGGVAVGAQAVLAVGDGAKPTVSINYLRSTFGGSAPDLDIGSSSQALTFLASSDLGDFHVDVNGIVADQSDDRRRRAQFGETLSISHPIGRCTIAGELWRFSQPLTDGSAAGMLWALSYAPRGNLVFDGGFNRGITSTSTRWEVFGGLTYLLPHRLWR